MSGSSGDLSPEDIRNAITSALETVYQYEENLNMDIEAISNKRKENEDLSNKVKFWSAYISCNAQYKDSVAQFLEQVDVIRRFINEYDEDFSLTTTTSDIMEVWKSGKIASLIGVEGGHAIDSRLAVLRMFYDLGVRYMTLTHSCHTPWAESSIADEDPSKRAKTPGLTEFGQAVVYEMNRLGMMVDLSHTSEQTQLDALNISKAPVIFSHSSAYTICSNSRNVKDNVLKLLAEKNGIIMVNFYPNFIQCNSSKNATIDDVIDHIKHIRRVTGSANHIGIGGDFDGVSSMPIGLKDTSKYPHLFDRLMNTEPKWSNDELKKLAGLNLLRVFENVEKVKKEMSSSEPSEKQLPPDQMKSEETICREKE